MRQPPLDPDVDDEAPSSPQLAHLRWVLPLSTRKEFQPERFN
jgi:hypothetical protein